MQPQGESLTPDEDTQGIESDAEENGALPEGTHIRAGVLSSTGFPGLLSTILSQKETGILTLRDDSIEKSVFIEQGRPIFASSTDPDDRLSNVFLRGGKITLAGLLPAVERSLRREEAAREYPCRDAAHRATRSGGRGADASGEHPQ